MTLKKLSEVTGYSLSTISKAFAGSKEIPSETKKIIYEEAKKLGLYDKYIKNSPKKPSIAIICPEIESEYYASIVAGFLKHIKRRGAIAMVSFTGFKISTEEELISYYSSVSHVDGIIVIGGSTIAKKYSPIPLVYLGGKKGNVYADVIYTDFDTGIYDAVSTLKDFGHATVAFVGDEYTSSKKEKVITALEKLELKVNDKIILTLPDRFEKCGKIGAAQLINSGEKFTAVIAGYDYIALGLIAELNKRGYRVPEDVSVIGFDDISVASHKTISLSTIRVNKASSVELATDLLFKKIQNKYGSLTQKITVRTDFVLRDSVKKIN